MDFLKTHSLGNDFIILDNPNLIAKKTLSLLAKKLCNRHTGIGADGILVALPSSKADIRMRIINADGSEANMCGNGIRCFAKYVFDYSLSKKKRLAIETMAGVIKTELTTYNNKVLSITIDLGKPVFKMNIPIKLLGNIYYVTSILMGVPHAIIFINKLDQKNISKLGPLIENYKLFPQKTNVDFVKIINRKKIKIMTWERGVGLSMACGTGAGASVVAAHLNHKTARAVTTQLGMGNLFVSWGKNDRVVIKGPAPQNICEGKILI